MVAAWSLLVALGLRVLLGGASAPGSIQEVTSPWYMSSTGAVTFVLPLSKFRRAPALPVLEYSALAGSLPSGIVRILAVQLTFSYLL